METVKKAYEKAQLVICEFDGDPITKSGDDPVDIDDKTWA